jgi:threonine dehydrogenase-like Zn-dependent dehydrogenase
LQALTVTPGMKDSLQLREILDPPPGQGSILVEALAVGLCGTDLELVAAEYGQAPMGESLLVLGRENLGREVHLFDRVSDGSKPDLVADLRAIHHTDSLADSGAEADVLVEWSGVSLVVLETMTCGATEAITCLTVVSITGRKFPVDIGLLNRDAVLGNEVIFGSVNDNRRHYATAVKALELADSGWLRRLTRRRVALADFVDAFSRAVDMKVVLERKGR